MKRSAGLTILLAGALAHMPTQQNLRRSSTTGYCSGFVGLGNSACSKILAISVGEQRRQTTSYSAPQSLSNTRA
eukprot:301560-Pleurochrysis_carterae.AAC.1